MNKLLCIMGETASGKSTIEKELVNSNLMLKITSITTRPPREGEVEGVDYYFVSDEQFETMVKNDELVEHVTYGTKDTLGKYFSYGLTKDEVDKTKKNPCVSVVTPHGYHELCKYLGKDNIIPLYIETEDDKRKEKSIERHKDQIELFMPEIERRFIGDKETFKDVRNIEGLYVVKNNYTKESFNNILKTIVQIYFYIGNRCEIGNTEGK